MAERAEPAVGQSGHHIGQLVERRCAGEQRVEGRVPEQVQRERPPLSCGTPSAPGHRDIADLAGPDAQASGVEGATEGQLDRLVAGTS